MITDLGQSPKSSAEVNEAFLSLIQSSHVSGRKGSQAPDQLSKKRALHGAR